MKIGIIGVGHLGKIHLSCLNALPQFKIVGYVDIDPQVKLAKLRRFKDLAAMLPHCDAVDIVTPSLIHHEMIIQCLSAGKHVFVEKPMCSTLQEAKEILNFDRKGLVVQIGHVERFNPAYKAVADLELRPMFLEVHRLSTFNQRGTDVSVVMDLMIHDLDIILDLVNSEIADIKATGVKLLSAEADICNARLQFTNGCVANVTASRISLKPMRKIRIFQSDAYVSLDFLKKQAQIIRLRDTVDMDDPMCIQTAKGHKRIDISVPETRATNAIQEELEQFYLSIVNGQKPKVGVQEAFNAINLAFKISTCAEKSVSILTN